MIDVTEWKTRYPKTIQRFKKCEMCKLLMLHCKPTPQPNDESKQGELTLDADSNFQASQGYQ